MAEQVSLIQFKGKLAQTVGFRGANGKNLIRERLTSIANPQTEAQMTQRARFKLAAQLSSMLGTVGRTALRANGDKATARGTLNKMLLPNISVNEVGVAELGYKLNLVNKPFTPKDQVVLTLQNISGGYVAYVTTAVEGATYAKTLLIYNTQTGQWRSASDISKKNSITIPYQGAESENNTIAYAYAIAIVPTTEAGRSILDNIAGIEPNNERGYLLAAQRLDSENFSYTRTMSATRPTDGEGYQDIIEPNDEFLSKINMRLKVVEDEGFVTPTSLTLKVNGETITVSNPSEIPDIPVDQYENVHIEVISNKTFFGATDMEASTDPLFITNPFMVIPRATSTYNLYLMFKD